MGPRRAASRSPHHRRRGPVNSATWAHALLAGNASKSTTQNFDSANAFFGMGRWRAIRRCVVSALLRSGSRAITSNGIGSKLSTRSALSKSPRSSSIRSRLYLRSWAGTPQRDIGPPNQENPQGVRDYRRAIAPIPTRRAVYPSRVPKWCPACLLRRRRENQVTHQAAAANSNQ